MNESKTSSVLIPHFPLALEHALDRSHPFNEVLVSKKASSQHESPDGEDAVTPNALNFSHNIHRREVAEIDEDDD